ncbi:MAG: stimulus-sensing domain-containing protein [Bdellovibrionales bacterium]
MLVIEVPEPIEKVIRKGQKLLQRARALVQQASFHIKDWRELAGEAAGLLRRTAERPVLGSYVRGQRISPLTLRIMAVNVLALAILVASILYLASYQDRLIEVEVEGLKNEARIFASAVAEGATLKHDDDKDELVDSLARQMVRRLDEVTDARTRLYDTNAMLTADSWVIGRAPNSGIVRVQLNRVNAEGWLERQVAALAGFFYPQHRDMPIYVEDDPVLPVVREEVMAALNGFTGVQVWKKANGEILFSVAVPIQSYKNVLGALNLTRDSRRMTDAIATVREDIILLFIGSLIITIILSLYLARAIARPIRLLAMAADAVRSGARQSSGTRGRGALREIPDFTDRHDEIGDLSSSLRSMTETLWKRMDAIETFAADVAHEIKNPLASIRSAIETLARVKDPVQQGKLLDILNHDVQRLDRLITDISGASRLDAELSRLESQRVDLAELLRTIVNVNSEQNKKIKVLLSTPAERVFVAGFEVRLAQVFQNLIENAVSFSPAKGTVQVTLMRAGNLAVVRVADSGPGIPEGKLEAVFDRFYTERPASESYGKHSGLGLSIVKQIVDAHKGRVYAANRYDQSQKVQGAVFTVELPIG